MGGPSGALNPHVRKVPIQPDHGAIELFEPLGNPEDIHVRRQGCFPESGSVSPRGHLRSKMIFDIGKVSMCRERTAEVAFRKSAQEHHEGVGMGRHERKSGSSYLR